MNKIFTFLTLCISVFSTAQSYSYAEDRLILAFSEAIELSNLEEVKSLEIWNTLDERVSVSEVVLLDRAYLKNESSLHSRPISIVFSSNIDVSETISALNESRFFDYVEPDYINKPGGKKMLLKNEQLQQSGMQTEDLITVPNDQFFNRQWGFHNNGSWSVSPSINDADVDMIEAWDLSTGNPNLIMAIIDSGLRMSHPEYSGRLWSNTAEVPDGMDNDGNGFIDDLNGWDFVNNDNDPTDDHGHGTNVAGIATATGNNNIGYAGVDWECEVMILKTLDSNNSGFNSNIIQSFYYALSKNVKVINISIGGSGFSSAYESAINAAYNSGVVVVACMMNFDNSVTYYPAAFANTIAVGSTDPDDTRSSPFFWSNTSGSNFGQHIDVVAPGNYMYGLNNNSDTNYNFYWGGTSQATPLVAGICSLMLSINPNLTIDEIRAILRNTAEDQVGDGSDAPGFDIFYGAGRVNAFEALNQTLNTLSNDTMIFSDLLFYPNPIDAIVHLKTNQNRKFVQFKVVNYLGQIIVDGNIENNMIDLHKLSKGGYILTAIDVDGNKSVGKIYKN